MTSDKYLIKKQKIELHIQNNNREGKIKTVEQEGPELTSPMGTPNLQNKKTPENQQNSSSTFKNIYIKKKDQVGLRGKDTISSRPTPWWVIHK